MDWVLTCRSTTEAPVLAVDHPLRRLFSRYGTWAARHVKTVLPLSGAVIFFFLYLFPFLYTTEATTITNGVSHLPHHVWTDARPLGTGSVVEPDVIMRSIWVHGSYMKAIDRDVLLGALELQDDILGPTTNFDPRQAHRHPALLDPNGDLNRQQRDSFHITNGVTDQSWFFHSPLQYWNGSAEIIAADDDLTTTVNERKTQATLANTTLRHSIVFSGKRFEERRLVAADALVITLIHMRDSPVGKQWVARTEALAQAMEQDGKWRVIPANGSSTSNQLYKFQFRPMSSYDWVMLTLAYSLTLANLLLRLSKLRAVKSRLGLMVTILVQIVASIVSSFTVCAIFKIDLSRVPHYAYPLVILAISIENSFRLINAVIMTSSTVSTSDRIGEAFGATAHIAIANRVQNSLMLYGMSKVTSSGVSAFCNFAAIATLFDFFYLATFFLAVLSVDVRQRELFELEKASLKRVRASHGGLRTQSWISGIYPFRLGDTAMSTRIAGSIVLFGFVLIAQAHYTSDGGRQWLNQLFSLSWISSRTTQKSSLLIDIHQARSPTSWLRLQDHETAQEVIKAIKPWAHSYVARVYDPIIFVMKGADRTPHAREPLFLPAVYDFVHHQIPFFVVSLLTMLATLRLFTNHLVRDQFEEDAGHDSDDDHRLLSVRSLDKGHMLDVAMLAASPRGQLVSVGLDRTIQIRNMSSGSESRVLCDPDVPLENPFPVLNLALDDKSKLLALISWQRVFLWNIAKQKWAGTRNIDLGGHKPEAVFFISKTPGALPSLVLVRRNGVGLEMQLETEDARDFAICKTPLVWAVHFAARGGPQQQNPHAAILTVSRKSCVHLVRQQDNEWMSTEVKLQGEPGTGAIHCLLPLPALSKYLIGRTQSVDLVDMESSTVIHTFRTEMMLPRTLKQISLTRVHRTNLASLSLSYTSAETGNLVVHTYLPETKDESRPPLSPLEQRPFDTWTLTKETTRHVPNPGTWEALPSGSIIGIRRKQTAPSTLTTIPTTTPTAIAGLRRRVAPNATTDYTGPTSSATVNTQTHGWEAWVLNLRPGAKPDFETRPLDEDPDMDQQQQQQQQQQRQHLMFSELGPMTRLGTMSVAVGLGDVVKVVSVGHEHFDRPRGGSFSMGMMAGLSDEGLQQVLEAGSRRKKGGSLGGLGKGDGGPGAGPNLSKGSVI
ncbi:sterol-sensing domain of SREBP cleavage-activation-domain-containing protein [Corynascus novoguineensis]|uniref:Sterol regulatory element-binding protein cleavage-activating protein n=1 Tax=Corynascus novoguineensis TaxID=1126955 RepID=A0AAN7HSR6_9PEZI|nr:sterol-sensing domain of SREBP cleavage-activation-domain-containing protein [Corynascus novoguineensis]